MRRVTITLWVALALALLNLSWTFLQRRNVPHRMQRTSAGVADRGTDLKILSFYATSGEIRDGDREILCYGVQNAKSVRMEPPVEELRPALTRCVSVEPHANMRYRLIAEGLDGGLAEASFEVRVKPALPYILFFAVSHKEIQRGDAVTMCYGVAHANSVELQPIGWQLAPIASNCARFYPKISHNYTLVAHGTEGLTDKERFRVGVR